MKHWISDNYEKNNPVWTRILTKFLITIKVSIMVLELGAEKGGKELELLK